MGIYTSENTIKNYARHLEAFFAFCCDKGKIINDLSDIQRDHVDAYKRHLVGLQQPTTVCAKLASILSFLKFCHQEAWTEKNVAAAIRLPKVEKNKGKTEALSECEIVSILESLEQNKAAFLLL